jgi:hypothetical protein
MAKSLVKPKRIPSDKPDTIPRLELQAIVLGINLVEYVGKQMNLDEILAETIIWSDSSCSISRLKRPEKHGRALNNLLNKVRGRYIVRHVRTEDNPADIATRGMEPQDLQNCNLWLHGPPWLLLPYNEWEKPVFEYFLGEEEFYSADVTLFEVSMAVPVIEPRSSFSITVDSKNSPGISAKSRST